MSMSEMQRQRDAPLKVFVSHSSRDADVAEALVLLLRAALGLGSTDIRCTSVDGCRLPGGADVAESIRSDIREALTCVGVISQVSARSPYVVWELGARWVLGSHFVPVITSDVDPSSLPPPLVGLNVLRINSPGQVHQLLEELAKHLDTNLQSPAQYQSQLDSLINLAKREVDPGQPREAVVIGAGQGGIEVLNALKDANVPIAGVYDKRCEAPGIPVARERGVPIYCGSSAKLLDMLNDCSRRENISYYCLLASTNPEFCRWAKGVFSTRIIRNCTLLEMGTDFSAGHVRPVSGGDIVRLLRGRPTSHGEPTMQPQSSPAEELPKEEISILQLLAKTGEYMLADEIATSLGLRPERAKYHLQRLVDAEYVHDSLSFGAPPEYGLIQKGRAYLVEHGML